MSLADPGPFAALGVDVDALGSGWLARRPTGRAIAVTPRGREGLRDVLGIDSA